MANSVDPDQTAPIGAVCSGSMLFASFLNSSVILGCYLQQIGLLRVMEYSDIRGSEYKIEYEYSSLPKSLDRDLFFFFIFFFFTFFVTETRSFSQNGPLKFFTMIDNISYSNTFVSCRLVISFIGNSNPQSIPKIRW